MRFSSIKNLLPLTHRNCSVFMTAKAQYTTYLPSENRQKEQKLKSVLGQDQQSGNFPPIQAKMNWFEKNPLTPLFQQERQLYRLQNFSFRILDYKQRKQALLLLAQAFDQKEPITESFNKKHPELKGRQLENWASYWEFFIDDLIDSGLSVAVFDTDANDQMVGIVVAKDYQSMPEGYQRKFMSNYNVVSQMMGLANFMIQRIDGNHRQILNQRTVVDLFGGAIKDNYVGKRLFSKILELNVALAKEKGYQYAFTYVTNFKSQPTLKKLDFQKVGDYDCREYEENFRRPFEMVQEMHKNPSIWFKTLE